MKRKRGLNLRNKEMNSQLELMPQIIRLYLLHCIGLAFTEEIKLQSFFLKMVLSISFPMPMVFTQLITLAFFLMKT